MSFSSRSDTYLDNLIDRLRSGVEERRREEREREREDERATETDAGTVETGDGGSAKVESVDFKAKTNAVHHRCEKYELVQMQKSTPVLRRGKNFSMDLKLNREVDLKKEYVMKLLFNFGNAPNVHKGTQGIINVAGKVMFDKSHEDWDARVAEKNGNLLTLEVQIPSSAPVGVWKLTVLLMPRGPNADRSIKHIQTNIYILFNPWNKHDTTYLPEDELREEYVLNDVGKLWQGCYPGHGRHWVYGQFDEVVLPACVLLLEHSGLRHEAHGDPVLVSRAISKMVNTNDGDNGVVVGRWDGSFDDGTPPSHWTGSINIMEEYVRRGKSVKYGQCWVFAGVTTTVCRALGLPSRPVTNFNSAHDTDASLTIDEYIDAKGDKITWHRTGPIPPGIADSIWEFHVWNDVWMDRPDLPPGYGGWQAIDATPQETSEGVYQCGPASHEAIRKGQVEFKYDVPFFVSEVNADVVHWQEDPDAQDGFKKLYSNKTHVGRQLVTKRVGHLEDGGYGKDRDDCTNLYKPAEGTEAERLMLQTAAKRFGRSHHVFRLPSEAEEDVNFSIEDIDRIHIGQDFTVTVKAQNISEKVRTVTIVLKAVGTYYTGGRAEPIVEASGKFTLQPNQSKTLSLPVPFEKYYDKLVEHALVKMVAHCRVAETSYTWVGDDCFEVTKPDILVKTLEQAVVGRRFMVRFSFTNPISRDLHECVLVVDGPGLTRPKTIPLSDVPAEMEMEWEYAIVPRKIGSFVLVATFNSVELQNLTGSVKINVAE